MDKIILFFICFSCLIFSQQKYYTFSELNGMEDNEGITHLFYRMYYENRSSQTDYSYENSIYHLNTDTKTDSLYLSEYSYASQTMSYSIYTHGFDLWDQDPAKFIHCYTDNGWYMKTAKINSPTTAIRRYDQNNPGFPNISGYASVRISNQNDSLIYGLNGVSIKSIDGGWNWEELPLEDLFFSDLNPYNDKFIFLHDYSGKLYKSLDGGETTILVDSTASTSIGNTRDPNHFEYESDTIHIYRVFEKKLFVSKNKGEPFSWQKKYSSENPLFISIDSSHSGHIYLADGRFIYHSTDYGETFNLFREFDRKLVGIYKKPNSEILYAATKYDLYEIRPDTIITLKHLEIDPEVFNWYPLKIGNKWVYTNTTCSFDFPFEPCSVNNEIVEVIGDTTLQNGFKYFIIQNQGIKYERYNEEDATVRRYTEDESFNSNEYVIEDFLMEVGDTSYTNRFLEDYYNIFIPRIFIEEKTVDIFNSSYQQKKYEVQYLQWYEYELLKGIGLYKTSVSFDFGWSDLQLKGAVIDGVVYGDTTLVGIDDEEENLPKEFSLSQNYPNPFNPTTKIKFTIPPNVISNEVRNLVTLKIYDILGNEVATLVNEEKSPGEYEVEFDASKYGLSSGVYFYQLKAGSFVRTKKLILLK